MTTKEFEELTQIITERLRTKHSRLDNKFKEYIKLAEKGFLQEEFEPRLQSLLNRREDV